MRLDGDGTGESSDYIPQSIGTAVKAALSHDTALKDKPGRGADILIEGRRRMHDAQQSIGMVADINDATWAAVQAEYEKGSKLCESPIERDILAALLTADWGFMQVAHPFVHDTRLRDDKALGHPVVIVPQMQVSRCRLDLGVMLRTGPGKVRIAAVECDGADWHDLADDALRDAYLMSFGVLTLRATGSRIFREPLRVADEAVSLMSQWVAL